MFTVRFKCQPNLDHVQEILEKTKYDDLKDGKALESLVKEAVEGRTVEMTCHLVKVENNLGRSTVIDLTAKTENKFRQVDHRTIEHIIYNNTKYLLKKGAKKVVEAEEEEKKASQWDTTQLAIGNWFSATSYYVTKEQVGDMIKTRCNGDDVEIHHEILTDHMHNADVYDREEKLPLTKVV